MKLIERYIYAVTEHLPKEIRDDVGKELRTNIEDMLPENYTESEMFQVLEGLGNPWQLANEYNPKKRYLIGPGYYDKYIMVLKLVVGICVTVFAGIAILVWATEKPFDGSIISHMVKLFTDLIVTVIEGVLQAVIWVTIVFIILERSGAESGWLTPYHRKWTPDDLPELPVQDNKKISRIEIVFSMFCTILFTAVVYFQPKLIAIYIKGEDGSFRITPFFDTERLQSYLVIIFLLAIVQLGIFVWKLLAGRWNLPLAIANTVDNALVCVLLIVMINDNSLLNAEFFAAIEKLTKTPVSLWLNSSRWIFAAVIIIICILDSASAFVKCMNRHGFKFRF